MENYNVIHYYFFWEDLGSGLGVKKPGWEFDTV